MRKIKQISEKYTQYKTCLVLYIFRALNVLLIRKQYIYTIESHSNTMIKQQAFEERDDDQRPMQDIYQPPVFNSSMDMKLAKTLSNIKEIYCKNAEAAKASNKGIENKGLQTSNKCQIDFGERPIKILLNFNEEKKEFSQDLQMSQLTIQFINEYKEYTPNLSAEQKEKLRQNVKHFLEQRKLSESHCRKILTQLSKERFIYGVYFQDMIFDLSRQGMMADVEQQLCLQMRTLRQYHQREENMLLQSMPVNIYSEYLETTIEKSYFPAYNPSSRETKTKKDKGDSLEKLMRQAPETNQSPFDLIPFKNLPQVYQVPFTDNTIVKIEDQYDG